MIEIFLILFLLASRGFYQRVRSRLVRSDCRGRSMFASKLDAAADGGDECPNGDRRQQEKRQRGAGRIEARKIARTEKDIPAKKPGDERQEPDADEHRDPDDRSANGERPVDPDRVIPEQKDRRK